jgi:hypothetical protein
VLRDNDEEAYIALVQDTKNERLTQLLAQTEEYLSQIGARVLQERERVNAFKTVAELETEREWMEKHNNKPTTEMAGSDMATAAVVSQVQNTESSEGTGDKKGHDNSHSATVVSQYLKQKREYYTFAHRIQEKITEQPSLLCGGDLKPYQMEGLQWLVSSDREIKFIQFLLGWS